MGLKVFSEAAKSYLFVRLVAECSVSLESQAVRFGEDIRSKNADMSNDKLCKIIVAASSRFSPIGSTSVSSMAS